jgi:Glycosyl transferase family 2
VHRIAPPTAASPADRLSVACLALARLPVVGHAAGRARLASLLQDRGISLAVDPGDCRERDVAAVIVGPEPLPGDEALRAVARRTGAPLLTLGPGRAPGRLRLGACDPTGRDRRLSRLLSTWGATLSDETVTAVAAALPVPAPAAPGGGNARLVAVAPDPPAAWRRALDPERLGPLAARHGLQLARGSDAEAAILLIAGNRPGAWDALAQGRELVCLGASPFAGLDLSHDAACPADLAGALASAASGRRNRRDPTRRALAAEALFNDIPAEPASLVAALDAAIAETGRHPRRSVSIVITSHNYRAFIGAAVESALAQTVPASEVVVVDDGSTDGSAELVAAIPGIVAVRKPQGGQASAFNAGFARTTGDVVLFLDADDRLLPEAVERIGAADQRGVSRLFFALETIDAQGRPTGLYTPGTPGGPAASGLLVGALMTHGIFPFVPTSGNAWPRWVLERLLPMPEPDFRLCADLFLVLGAAALGEAAPVDGVLGQYRIHGSNRHFRPLGDRLHTEEPRLRQRRLAWRHLADRAPSALPAATAGRIRRALDRLARSPDADAGGAPGDGLPAAGRGTTLATSADPAVSGPQPAPIDLLSVAGAAGWPRVGPGDRVDLTASAGRHGATGRGWSRPEGNGVRLLGREGTLAIRLPEIGGNWRLRLAFTVEGDTALRGVEVALNGTRIDRVDLHRLGTIDLDLPAGLLLDWRTIAPGPGPGALAACLALRVPAGDHDRLWLSELRVDPLPATLPPAPRLPPGRMLRIADGDPFTAACLGAGWDWPGRHGARLAAANGRIGLSLAERGAHALALVLDAAEAGEPAPRAAQLRVAVNGVLAAAHATPHPAGLDREADCVTLVAALPARTATPDGRLDVDLQVCSDPDTGAWPSIRLRGMRLDRLADQAGLPVLAPNLPAPAGPLVGHHGADAEGLVADGGVARITAPRFRLRLRPAAVEGGRLLLRLGREGPGEGAAAATLRAGGGEVRLWFGRDAVVPLDLAAVDRLPGAPVVVDGSLDGRTRGLVLRSVELRRAPFAPEPCGVPVWTDHLGPEALAACATDPASWHPPVPDGLWLAGAAARLVLPPPPPGAHALAVSVLTLDTGSQRLRLALAGQAVATTCSGPETLHLPLPEDVAARPTLELAVTCHGLVAADLVGATPPGVLGGALCRIAVLPGHNPRSRARAPARASGSRP